MSPKSVAAKARVKPGTTVAVLNAVPGVSCNSSGLPVGGRVREACRGPARVPLRADAGGARIENAEGGRRARVEGRSALGVLPEGLQGRRAFST